MEWMQTPLEQLIDDFPAGIAKHCTAIEDTASLAHGLHDVPLHCRSVWPDVHSVCESRFVSQ